MAEPVWEELRWAVGAFDTFKGMRLEERELFRKCLEEAWCMEDLIAKGVTVAPTGDDAPPEKAVDLKDVPEGVTPFGWSLMQKTLKDGDVGKPSTELADTKWTAREMGVMIRLVGSVFKLLRWLGMTQEEYDGIMETETEERKEGQGKAKKAMAQRKRKGKEKGEEKGKGTRNEKAEEPMVQEKGQLKRIKVTPKRKGPEKKVRSAEAESGPGESSAGVQIRMLKVKSKKQKTNTGVASGAQSEGAVIEGALGEGGRSARVLIEGAAAAAAAVTVEAVASGAAGAAAAEEKTAASAVEEGAAVGEKEAGAGAQ